jgi:hypothetical protein
MVANVIAPETTPAAAKFGMLACWHCGRPISLAPIAMMCPHCQYLNFLKGDSTMTEPIDSSVRDQPAPVPNNERSVWSLVIEDMQERDQVGRARYGVPLQPHNGRNAIVDAYQEALDMVVYLRQFIEEQKGTPVSGDSPLCDPGLELTFNHDVFCACGALPGQPHAQDCPFRGSGPLSEWVTGTKPAQDARRRLDATPVDNRDVPGYVDDALGDDQ